MPGTKTKAATRKAGTQTAKKPRKPEKATARKAGPAKTSRKKPRKPCPTPGCTRPGRVYADSPCVWCVSRTYYKTKYWSDPAFRAAEIKRQAEIYARNKRRDQP